jgi:hypothetical protein
VAAKPPPPVPAPFYINAWVLEPWHDADTGLFRVDRGNRDYSVWSVRVLGCAARELADPGGPEARDWLRMLLPVGTPVVLTTAKPDKFGGRIDAHVWFQAVGGPADLTEVMIGAGWAARWNGTGEPVTGGQVLPPERLRLILSRTVETGAGCWEWQGARDRRGYGRAGYGPRHLGTGLVHRMVWASLRGQVDAGLELDHLCRNPSCCNPDHLEPVTHEENVRRGEAGLNLLERAATVMHCPRGHPYDHVNTYRRRGRPGSRECRTCRNDASRQRRKRTSK